MNLLYMYFQIVTNIKIQMTFSTKITKSTLNDSYSIIFTTDKTRHN